MSSGITDFFGSAQSDSSSLEQMCGGFQLTRMQRFYAFGICFAVGIVLSLCSTLLLISGNRPGFAVLYTIGNIIGLVATGFLTGFISQLKKMFDSTRIIATCVFLGSMVATLVVAFTMDSVALIFVLCIIQYFALFWYSISYIPFARDAIIKGCTGCIS